jgi:hypothetical protein
MFYYRILLKVSPNLHIVYVIFIAFMNTTCPGKGKDFTEKEFSAHMKIHKCGGEAKIVCELSLPVLFFFKQLMT